MALPTLTPTWIGTPHFAAGRRGQWPEAVVIHIIEGTLGAADSWFRDPASKVSAHYGIGRTGALHQYVREEDTAWHAGKIVRPTWTGFKRTASGARINPNQYTIGVEHEGWAASAWPDAMYARSAMLLAEIHVRWGVPLDRQHVIGHREIRADKTCPGSVVDLARLIAMAKGALR